MAALKRTGAPDVFACILANKGPLLKIQTFLRLITDIVNYFADPLKLCSASDFPKSKISQSCNNIVQPVSMEIEDFLWLNVFIVDNLKMCNY